MTELIIAALAIFWAWETVLAVCPWTIPAWLQPLLVLAGATAFCWPDWRVAMAAAGAVGLLHFMVREVGQPSLPPAAAVRLRPGIGNRVPNLP